MNQTTHAPMKRHPMKRPLALLALPLMLAGCGWMGEKAADPLPGERISVLQHQQALAADPAAGSVQIPAAGAPQAAPVAGITPDHAPGNLAFGGGMTVVFSSDIGEGSSDYARIVNPPVVSGGRLFVADAGGHVTAIEAGSGARVWQADVSPVSDDGEEGTAGVAASGDTVFVATGFGEAMALSATDGKILWRVPLGTPARAAPAIGEGAIYVMTADNQTLALKPEDGSVLWQQQGLLQEAGLVGAPAPAQFGRAVVVGYSSGEVYALHAENGRAAWSDSLQPLRRGSGVDSLADIRGRPAIFDTKVLVTSHAGRTALIDLGNGARLWQRDTGSSDSPWVAGNSAFLSTTDNELVALSLETGAPRWVTGLPGTLEDPVVWTGPVLAGGRLYIAGSNGQLLSADPVSGALGRALDVGGRLAVAPVVANNTLYLLRADGSVVAVR